MNRATRSCECAGSTAPRARGDEPTPKELAGAQTRRPVGCSRDTTTPQRDELVSDKRVAAQDARQPGSCDDRTADQQQSEPPTGADGISHAAMRRTNATQGGNREPGREPADDTPARSAASQRPGSHGAHAPQPPDRPRSLGAAPSYRGRAGRTIRNGAVITTVKEGADDTEPQTDDGQKCRVLRGG